MKKSDTKVIIEALRILAVDIKSDDGVANACIFEAADRLEELQTKLDKAVEALRFYKDQHITRDFFKIGTTGFDFGVIATKTLEEIGE